MIDATALARHRAIAKRSHYRGVGKNELGDPTPGKGHYEGWTLSGLGDGLFTGALPPVLRGDWLTEYVQRKTTVTAKSVFGKEPDRLRPLDYEAMIARRLGWKARVAEPTIIYWRHMPIARFVSNGSSPHFYISAFDTFGKAQTTRALFAMNPLLDFLMTGVRLDMKGVHITRRHEVAPWPKTFNKPGLYIPVAGRGHGVPFWEAKTFEFVSHRPVTDAGGTTWEEPRPWAAPLSYEYEPDDDLKGLT